MTYRELTKPRWFDCGYCGKRTKTYELYACMCEKCREMIRRKKYGLDKD